jgi:hypothetical protein
MSKRKYSEIDEDIKQKAKVNAPSENLVPIIRNSGNNNLSVHNAPTNESSMEVEIESRQNSLTFIPSNQSEEDLYSLMCGLEIDK